MAMSMSTPHDHLFKSTFSQPEHAIEFFRSALPPEVVRHIDFASLQVEPESFIDDKLRARFSDLLFSVRIARHRAYLYLLFEHQSRPERLMCVRLLRYVTDIWNDHLKNHPRARGVPIVIPLVLHHGERGWRAPVSLRDLYDAPADVIDDLRPCLPDFRFILDDLAPLDDAALRARALAALPTLVLWSFRHVRRGRDVVPALRQVLDLMIRVVRAPHGTGALATLLRYIMEVSESSEEQLQEFFEAAQLPQANEALMTAAEKLIRRGREEGHREGHREGRQEGQCDLLIKLMRFRFGTLPERVMARLRAADQAQLERWAERVLTAPTLDAVLDDVV